jgi:hypothetical protein
VTAAASTISTISARLRTLQVTGGLGYERSSAELQGIRRPNLYTGKCMPHPPARLFALFKKTYETAAPFAASLWAPIAGEAQQARPRAVSGGANALDETGLLPFAIAQCGLARGPAPPEQSKYSVRSTPAIQTLRSARAHGNTELSTTYCRPWRVKQTNYFVLAKIRTLAASSQDLSRKHRMPAVALLLYGSTEVPCLQILYGRGRCTVIAGRVSAAAQPLFPKLKRTGPPQIWIREGWRHLRKVTS